MGNTFHIQWHITDRCNLRCRHCYQDNFTSKDELSFASLKRIFTNIVEFAEDRGQKIVIDITGGEPLLYKPWRDLLSLIYHHTAVKKTGIITNGFFLDNENLKFLEGFKNLQIKVSAEGVSKEMFELFRGKDNHKIFTMMCKRLKEALPENEKILMFTLTKENIKEVPHLFNFITEYNFNSFILERFISWGRGKQIYNSVISVSEWAEMIRTLCNKCDVEEDLISLAQYRGFMVRQDKECGFSLFGAPCIIGVDGIAVMPDGTVFPCRRLPLNIGKLTENSLKDIWEHSDILKNLTSSPLKGKCKNCKIRNCRGCRALAYSITGDLLEEDPVCCL